MKSAIIATALTGAAMIAIESASPNRSVGSLFVVCTFAVLIAINWAIPLLVLRKEQTEAFILAEGFFVAMALLMPDLGVLVASGLGALVGQMVLRRPAPRIAFNVGQLLTSTWISLKVVHSLPIGNRFVTVIVGAGVFFIVNSALVSLIIALAEERSPLRVFVDDLAFRVLVLAGSITMGLLVGLASEANSLGLLVAVVPLGVVQFAFSGTIRAKRDRQRIDGLLQTALAAHSSVTLPEVEKAITEAAGDLLQYQSVRIAPSPPERGELGGQLPATDEGDKWLLVSEPRSVKPLVAEDQKLLDAIVAVGSGAVQNARLVDQIKHQAFHDTLTGLPNQLLFEERVNYALAQANRTNDLVAVLILDLDRFKNVNDSLGHSIGNQLLQRVAARFSENVRLGDTVARMSGDEFIFLLTGIKRPTGAAKVAEKILDSLRRPFTLGRYELFVRASIGIALYPESGMRPEALLKNADRAMYFAKQRGGNSFHTYTAELNTGTHDRLTLEADLYNAIEREELDVYYQPKVEVSTARVIGVEALVRWKHPELGFLSPDVFIPLAEETGLILDLDAWVLRTACEEMRALNQDRSTPLRLAVNVSGRQLQHGRLVDGVADTLRVTGLAPELLELEMTERVAVEESGDVLAALQKVRDLGVRVAIDDFGTGYSMLNRLLKFPIDTLKIDKSFVQEIGAEDGETPVVNALVAMGHGLGMEVVAEGVETEQQWRVLQSLGCDHAQGYLFARPVEASQLSAVLATLNQMERDQVA